MLRSEGWRRVRSDGRKASSREAEPVLRLRRGRVSQPGAAGIKDGNAVREGARLRGACETRRAEKCGRAAGIF